MLVISNRTQVLSAKLSLSLSPSLSRHRLNGRGVQQNDSLADGYTQVFAPDAFSNLGAEPSEYPVVVIKSANHVRSYLLCWHAQLGYSFRSQLRLMTADLYVNCFVVKFLKGFGPLAAEILYTGELLELKTPRGEWLGTLPATVRVHGLY